jgi:hypothetical protein
MNEEEVKIAGIVGNIELSNRPRITKREKAVYIELINDVGAVKKKLEKLSLRLWHSKYKSDYHSFKINDAERALKEIADEINRIVKMLNCSEQ